MSVKQLLQQLVNSEKVDLYMTEKQLNIVSSAIELFAEKGFAATSTSEIAKKAGVAEGTIFRHYKTKKDLLLAIPDYVSLLSNAEGFLEKIKTVAENSNNTFEDFLRAIFQDRKQFASTNVILIKILFQEISFHPELLEKVSKIIFEPAREKLLQSIEVYKSRGEINDIPSGVIVNLIISTIFGFLFTKYVMHLDLDWGQEEESEYIIHYIKNGISAHSTLSTPKHEE